MNAKKLKEKLEGLTQEIIENVPCPKCRHEIHYILVSRGSAGCDPSYLKVATKKVKITSQDGRWHEGFQDHICKKK